MSLLPSSPENDKSKALEKSQKDPLLTPFRLGHLLLRNRIMSTAHAPSYVENGWPTDRYRLYHEEKAKGGIAMTMVGGSSNISPDSPSAFGQIYAGDDSVIPWFEKLTNGVRAHGAAIMCQITHMGRRTHDDVADWLPVISSSHNRERAHRSFPKIMEQSDIKRVVKHFADAAYRCKRGGFDGIELLAHSHLLGQFLSPNINQRCDAYGGSLTNRMRMPLQVLEAVRDTVGSDFIVGIRLTGSELTEGGLELDESIEIAHHITQGNGVDFINVMIGAPYDDLGLAGWITPMGAPVAGHLDIVKKIRNATTVPVFHAGGIADLATARHVLREGIVDMVGMTRAHIADPHLIAKLTAGQEDRIRICVGMNYCVDRVNQGKDALCGQNPATGRERKLPHKFSRVSDPLKAVVVGGGPSGMEAARILAEKGHNVVLFEASNQLGGQVRMAAASTSRRQMLTVTDWLASELAHLGVDIRYNVFAEAEDVMAEAPELVVIATGGLPRELNIPGRNHTASIWDILSGSPPNGKVMIFDDRGESHTGVAAELAAVAGATVTLVTPDRTPFQNLGPTNYAVLMRNLYKLGVNFKTDTDLVCARKDGNRVAAEMKNVLSGELFEDYFDSIYFEQGTEANADLYFDLVDGSVNSGEISISSLVDARPEFPKVNPDGSYVLFRIGDAVSSRNVHAALHDALRICANLDIRLS